LKSLPFRLEIFSAARESIHCAPARKMVYPP
jgi:hypothetical protein